MGKLVLQVLYIHLAANRSSYGQISSREDKPVYIEMISLARIESERIVEYMLYIGPYMLYPLQRQSAGSSAVRRCSCKQLI